MKLLIVGMELYEQENKTRSGDIISMWVRHPGDWELRQIYTARGLVWVTTYDGNP